MAEDSKQHIAKADEDGLAKLLAEGLEHLTLYCIEGNPR
jgi:hypothetical protein